MDDGSRRRSGRPGRLSRGPGTLSRSPGRWPSTGVTSFPMWASESGAGNPGSAGGDCTAKGGVTWETSPDQGLTNRSSLIIIKLSHANPCTASAYYEAVRSCGKGALRSPARLSARGHRQRARIPLPAPVPAVPGFKRHHLPSYERVAPRRTDPFPERRPVQVFRGRPGHDHGVHERVETPYGSVTSGQQTRCGGIFFFAFTVRLSLNCRFWARPNV